MARTKNKPRQKDRQPLLENFMQKVAAQAGDDTQYLVNPRGEISISDAITQLIEPYKEDAPDYQSFRTLVTFACTAWNATILPPVQRDEMLAKMCTAHALNQRDQREMLELITALMSRKTRLFPQVTRMIVDFKVTDRGADFHIAVASTLSQPPRPDDRA